MKVDEFHPADDFVMYGAPVFHLTIPIPHMTLSCTGHPSYTSTTPRPAHDFVMYGAPVVHLSTPGPAGRYTFSMPDGLKRYQRAGDVHLVTFSCDGRLPYLAEGDAYSTFEQVLERMRARHGLLVFGYVLMPEHVHLLVSGPPVTRLDAVLTAVKQASAKKLRLPGRKHFWEERYHDFNVFSEAKFKEKLRYIHRNPVERGLVTKPEEWRWSSFCHYQTGFRGTIEVESWWTEQARTRLKEIDPGGGESRT